MKRYVLVSLDTDDWGAVDAALYVASYLNNFMGEVRVTEIDAEAVDRAVCPVDIDAAAREASRSIGRAQEQRLLDAMRSDD